MKRVVKLRVTTLVWLVVGSLVLLWTISVPLLASPDEPANFVKSAAIVRGELTGEDVAPEMLKSYWTTIVKIDPQFGSVNALPWCFAPYPDKPACTYDVATAPQVDGVAWTNMGKYPPLGFAITGMGTIFGPTNLSVYAARVVQAVVCVALLGCVAVALRRRGRSLAGLVVAVTPGTLFLAATSSPSGLEIVASIAVWITTAQLLRGESSRLERLLFGVAGVLVIGTRPLGLVFYATILGIGLLITRCSVVNGARLIGRHILLLHAAVACFMVWWYVAVYGPATRTKIDFGDTPLSIDRQLDAIVRGLPRIFEQYIGNFGWLDTPAPGVVVWAGLGLIVVSAALAWRLLDWRVWTSILLLIAAATVFVVLADLNYYQLLRTFGSQGRHFAPFLVGVPLLLGERIPRGSLASLGIYCVSAAMVTWSFVVMIRRYSVGVTAGNFSQMWNDPPWVPPFGVTGSFLAIGAVSVAAVAVLYRDERQSR